MSTESNKALCRRYIEEVWNRQKLGLLEEIFTPEYVDHDPASPQFGKGPEAERKLIQYYLKAFPDTQFKLEEVLAEGDRVVMRWTVRGTHRGEMAGVAPTGRQIAVSGTTVARIANDRIAESWTNWDALGLMRQIGAVSMKAGGAGA